MTTSRFKPASVPISVVVLTKNEQANIADCLRNLAFSDDIVVLDSYSQDQTPAIVQSYKNVRLQQRHFDTEYKQRNFSLHEIAYKNPWLYICDADERLTDELIEEMLSCVSDPQQKDDAFRLRYKNMYLGKWIKHATSYPVWIIRLVKPKQVHYEQRQTNVHPIVAGSIGELNEHFIHNSFSNGLKHWFSKHNFYSGREAIEAVGVRQQGCPTWRELRQKDPMARRRAIKNLSFFLVGRAFFRFIYQYILQLGFLDGLAGFHYCAMISMYEYWIEIKITEQEKNWDKDTRELAKQSLTEVV